MTSAPRRRVRLRSSPGECRTPGGTSGDQPGRLLVTFMPAGMEGFFERLSLMDAFDIEEFRAAGAEHGTEIVGPRLAEDPGLSGVREAPHRHPNQRITDTGDGRSGRH